MNDPFRIRSAPALQIKTEAADVEGQAAAGGSYDDYLQRLIKLVPAEIIGLYLTLKGFYNADLEHDWMVSAVPPVCLILLIISRIRTTGWQWIAVGVSAVSFVIWLGATADPLLRIRLNFADPRLWSVLVLLWTFVVPWFYKGDAA